MGGLLIIGLTGTFGSGKSVVAEFFAQRGAAVIDADRIAREVVEVGSPALAEIREAFGEEFLLPDGGLDRRKMAALVFDSSGARRKLEKIIHPRVGEEMRREICRLQQDREADGKPEAAVLNVPLLFENGLEALADKTVAVAVGEGERFRRVRKRDAISERQVLDRLAAQWPQRRKVALADYVIDNSGDFEQTRQRVVRLYEQMLNEAANESSPQSILK